MSFTTTTTTAVLTNAAEAALHAPSVFNTQPWKWIVGTDHRHQPPARPRRDATETIDHDATESR
jgi:nitroreductase